MTLLDILFCDIGAWSNKTFGDEKERGPVGPLKHLIKEIEIELLPYDPMNLTELSDVLILLLDATRRAGYNSNQLYSTSEKIIGEASFIIGSICKNKPQEKNKENVMCILSRMILEVKDNLLLNNSFYINNLAFLFLLLMAANLQSGYKIEDLINAATVKMQVNKTRTYNKPTGDEISEHVR